MWNLRMLVGIANHRGWLEVPGDLDGREETADDK